MIDRGASPGAGTANTAKSVFAGRGSVVSTDTLQGKVEIFLTRPGEYEERGQGLGPDCDSAP